MPYFRALCYFTQAAGADHEFSCSSVTFHKDAELVIAFKIIDHLYDWTIAGIGTVIEDGAAAVRDDRIPLRSRVAVTAKAVECRMFLLDEKSHGSHSNRLFHPVADITEHRITPEISTIKSFQTFGNFLWQIQHAFSFGEERTGLLPVIG